MAKDDEKMFEQNPAGQIEKKDNKLENNVEMKQMSFDDLLSSTGEKIVEKKPEIQVKNDSVGLKTKEKAIQENKVVSASDGSGDKIITKDIDVVMHESMLPYSEHVILDRALPRVEDGLKPVQRRILFAMNELGFSSDKPHKKCAKIVGEVLGKYHPHGDSAVYGALVRLAQNFNMREILIDGHGNFGSVDGDSAAAMRYTEARLAPIAAELLRDLDKKTVNWELNFDDTIEEPVVLPSRFPNLLVNGSSGIAVGLATNIPPHNLDEVISGVVAFIDNPDITVFELMKYIKAPDFPTGGYIFADDELVKAYETGRGKIILRSKVFVETLDNDKKNIVITELPYQVNKASLLQKIADLRESKKDKLAGISDIADESDRSGMRAVIKVRKDADVNEILELLFKYSDLQVTFGINMVAIAGGKPEQLGLKSVISYYVDFQREVIVRRTKFDLDSARDREHVLEGLVVAVTNIDEVIRIIKKAENIPDARNKLKERFALSERQAQAVLDIRLAALTSLEITKLQNELAELKKLIIDLTAILNSKKAQFELVKKELIEIQKKYKTPRRSQILTSLDEFVAPEKEDSKEIENIVIAINQAGGIKKMNEKHFNSAAKNFTEKSSENDIHTVILKTSSDKLLLGFSNLGNAFKFSPDEIEESRWKDKGVKLASINSAAVSNEKLVAVFEFDPKSEGELLFFSANGMLKRTPWSEYALQKNFYQAAKFKEDDQVLKVENFEKDGSILFVTEKGLALNAEKTDIPVQMRISGGVKGVAVSEGDKLLFAGQVGANKEVALISDKGFAKRVNVSEIDILARYRKGVKIFELKGVNGSKVVFAGFANEDIDIVCAENDGLFTCFSSTVFPLETRTSKGRALSKNPEGMNIKNAFSYLV